MKTFRPSFINAGLMASTAALILCGGAAAGPGTAAGLVLAAQSATAAGPVMNPGHPDQYVVKRGDTLWDISAMFLRDPWYWPEIWYANPQVENPHLIYPGDVLTLVYVDGQPRLQLQRGTAVSGNTEKLSPRIREEALEDAIPAIPLDVIGPFLSRGVVLQRKDIAKTPYVVSIRDGHLVGAMGQDLYVRGDLAGMDHGYNVVHVGKKLVDPDDGDILGYEGIYVGAGTIVRTGDPSTLSLNDSAREAMEGDRLISQDISFPGQFVPRPAPKSTEGSIIHIVDGVSQVGQYQVIIINRGSRDGLEPGHVLRVWQKGARITDHNKPGRVSQKVDLPDEPAAVSMVFRTYERSSYALIMRATNEVNVLDIVRNPT